MSATTDMSTVSQHLQDLISNNSELGSRLLSLLLVSSGNGKEIISAINNGGDIHNLDLKLFNETVDSLPTGLQKGYDDDISVKKEVNEHIEEEDKDAKRKKNTAASARFRKRRKERELAKVDKVHSLNKQIKEFNERINKLVDENDYWKLKLKNINEKKSNDLLRNIKRRNMQK